MRKISSVLAAGVLATFALAACSSRTSGGAAPQASAANPEDEGWQAYGGDPGGTRYSPLTQISPTNVDRLQVAWTFRTGELGKGVTDWRRSAFEATPILYERTLYFTTPSTNVVAVDAVTGALRWRHDS